MPGGKGRAKERNLEKKVMQGGNISELGCDGPRLGDSIPGRLVNFWSAGCGHYRSHCDGGTRDPQIQLDTGWPPGSAASW